MVVRRDASRVVKALARVLCHPAIRQFLRATPFRHHQAARQSTSRPFLLEEGIANEYLTIHLHDVCTLIVHYFSIPDATETESFERGVLESSSHPDHDSIPVSPTVKVDQPATTRFSCRCSCQSIKVRSLLFRSLLSAAALRSNYQ